MRPNQKPTIEELYAAHGDAVYRYCVRLCYGNEADAQDLAQETWVRALQGLEGYKGEATVRTWLYRIALNIRLKRRQKRANSMESLKDLETEGGSEDPRSNQLVRLWLDSGLAALPEALYQALILVKAEGMTHKEAAAVLGLPQGTVQYQVHEAIKRLRKLLSDDPRSPYMGALVPLSVLDSELPHWGNVTTPAAVSARILEELRRLSPEALPQGEGSPAGMDRVRGSGRAEAPGSDAPRLLLDRRAVIGGAGALALLVGGGLLWRESQGPPAKRELRTLLGQLRTVDAVRAQGTYMRATHSTVANEVARLVATYTYQAPASLRQDLVPFERGPKTPSEILILEGSRIQRRHWVGRQVVRVPSGPPEQGQEDFAPFDFFSARSPLERALKEPNVTVTVQPSPDRGASDVVFQVVQRENSRVRRWTIYQEPGTRRIRKIEYVIDIHLVTGWDTALYVVLDNWDYNPAVKETDFQLPKSLVGYSE